MSCVHLLHHRSNCRCQSSSKIFFTCGVPQSFVLCPILFVLCTYRCSTMIYQHSPSRHIYSDDNSLCRYTRLSGLKITVQHPNREFPCMYSLNLRIKPEKTIESYRLQTHPGIQVCLHHLQTLTELRFISQLL